MSDNIIFLLMGGLGFFFLGMRTMSEGLKKIAGERLKSFLHYVTQLPIIGVLVGALITILIQSSSATTVMVVGFVNAGLLSLKQAITVIMGANIGTTFTAWLVSSMSVFKVTQYTLPAIGIGFALSAMTKTKKRKSWGEVILGFGLLFLGLSLMKDAFEPFKDSELVRSAFVTLSHYPLLGVLAGIIFTFLLQSSSATITIVQLLAFNGVISFEAAIPIILGENIGTTITAQMAAMGTSLNARRAAMSHTLFNVIGVTYILPMVYLGWFVTLIDAIIPGPITTTNVMFYIAISHSCFNILNTLVFLPFTGLLERASIWLVPQKEGTLDTGPQYLEKHLLETPSFALEQVHNESVYMLKVARKAVVHSVEAFLEKDLKKAEKTIELETITDNLQSEITQYLIDLSQRNLMPEESEELPVLIHNVNDLERIGDHAQNIAELTRRAIEEKLPFTEQAFEELQLIRDHILTMFEESSEALSKNDPKLARKVLEREAIINNLQDEFKVSHITRLNEGSCHLASGFVFIEVVDNLEKVGDRLTNIAEGVIGKLRWEAVHEHPKA